MKLKLLNRWIYLVILLLLLLGAFVIGNIYPSLLENPVNTLGFLGFWITLYGIVIAIFEIVRTGSIANQMAVVAKDSHNKLKRQIELQEIQDCIEMINSTLSDLQNRKAISIIFMTRIKKGYISIFSKKEIPEFYQTNLNILNSYEHVTQSRNDKVKANPKYIAIQGTQTLSDISTHPYKLTIETLKRMMDEILTHTASKNEYIGDSK